MRFSAISGFWRSVCVGSLEKGPDYADYNFDGECQQVTPGGAASGRASLPFREEIREIATSPKERTARGRRRRWWRASVLKVQMRAHFRLSRLASAILVSRTRKRIGRAVPSSCQRHPGTKFRITCPRCGARPSMGKRLRASLPYSGARGRIVYTVTIEDFFTHWGR